MSKYRNNAFYEELEEELKELEHQEEKPKEDPVDIPADKPKTVEEQTWKKRYGDLRRLQQDTARQVEELRTQLQTTAKEKIEYPKTKEEVENWMQKFPDIGGIVRTIAMEEATRLAAKADERFANLEEREAKTAWEKEYNKLLKAHPDFEELRVSDEFVDWVRSKPTAFTAPLRGNDGEAAAEVVTAYKRETKPVEEPKKPKNDASRSIPRGERSEPANGKDKNLIYESDMETWDHVTQMKMATEVDKAIAEGRFVYDISNPE